MHCLAEPVWHQKDFEDLATLHWRSVFGGELHRIEDVAFFAYATPRVPDPSLDTMQAALTAAGVAVHRAGDCLVARGVLEATAQGHAVGMAI